MKIFVVYSWDDAPIRRALAAELRHLTGVEVLYDRQNLSPSDQLHHGISDLLDEADCVVAILSPVAVTSREVLDELARANERRKIVIPLVHKSLSLEQIPHYLRESVRIDYNERSIDQALDSLGTRIASERSREQERTQDERKQSSPDNGQSLVSPPSTVVDLGAFNIGFLQRSNLARELLEQVITMCKVFNFAIMVNEKPLEFPLLVAPNVFIPDGWTQSLIEGIVRLPPDLVEGKTLVEVGVGTGVIPIALQLLDYHFGQYIAYDIDTLAARLAVLNVDIHSLSNNVAIRGGGSIFEPERGLYDEGLPYSDLVLANVPQVPSLSTGPIRDQFDYYHMPPTLRGEEEMWAMQGLWLVAEILRDSKTRLRSGGSVIVSVGGRPLLEHIEGMFEALGYQPEVIHRCRIQQDPETDISAMAYFERTRAIQYAFFPTARSRASIGATTAYDRISSGKPCFHDIFVIRGTFQPDP